MLGFAIPASLLAISLLGESAPLTSCSIQVAICPEDEGEKGEEQEGEGGAINDTGMWGLPNEPSRNTP